MLYAKERAEIADCCRAMLRAGLTTGSGGNISARIPGEEHLCISPTGILYERMQAADVPVVDMSGRTVDGVMLPSSEAPMHLAVYAQRSDVRAIVHTHSPYAATFACLREEIPAVHYLIGFAGTHVPVAQYATYGTPELAEHAVRALGTEFQAILLANHGLLAVGPTIERAYAVAEEIELVARIHYQARTIGQPVILDDAEMKRIIGKFHSYGVQPCEEE
ncbi:MAG: class II aldolase/adducin family protein [Bacteroidetes bacterium]|nr:class II aldolase/adducin family protein [Bacteroidota bacterium]